MPSQYLVEYASYGLNPASWYYISCGLFSRKVATGQHQSSNAVMTSKEKRTVLEKQMRFPSSLKGSDH